MPKIVSDSSLSVPYRTDCTETDSKPVRRLEQPIPDVVSRTARDIQDSVDLSQVATSAPSPDPPDAWLKAPAAAKLGAVSTKTVYTAVRSGRLRAARVGGRRSLRFRASWVHAWLEADAAPIEITRATTLRVAR